jgi:pimeloyl-ACP methyl ester carboxylesterase
MPYAHNGDVRIHYTVEGCGPPLVLHHGFTGSGRDWETFGFVAGLRDAYQLIMLDARGHGASDTPHEPSAYGFAHGAGDVVAVLNELGFAQAHYYGYSYGGAMGWALGWYAPERFASLSIGGAHPFPPSAEVWDRFDEMRGYLALGMDAYVAWREGQPRRWPPAFRERMLANDARALAALVTAYPDLHRTEHVDDALRRMRMLVLVISGDDDELLAGSDARRAAGALIDASFVEIADASHGTLYVRSDLVLPHLGAFLARVTAPQPALANT